VRLYDVLVDGQVTLNLISLVAFKKLQVLMSKLIPLRPFSVVGPGSIMPCGSISLSVTFRTPENYHRKSVIFDVMKVNLPFKVILGRLTLYQFMVVAHYGYLVLKMPSPNGVIKIHGDRSAGVFALEKLHALAAAHEGAARPGDQD
jgi:hypothetical protein